MTVDFLGIGAQKAGTTWLYHQLSRHPQIAFPGGKEVHFWDRVDPAFASRWLETLQPATRLTPDGRPIRCGEITPAYATLAPATIAVLRRTCPEIRLFISLRNPLTRAWSHALMVLGRGNRSEHEADDRWFVDQFRSQDSLQRGAYTETLARWWEAFPREQLLVTLLDDIVATPRDVLTSLARHLRVDLADFARLPAEDVAAVVVPAAGERGSAGQPRLGVRPSLLPVLRDLYDREVERLSVLLARDLSGWRAGCDPSPEPSAGGVAPRLPVVCRGPGTAVADALADARPSPEKPP